MQPRHGRFPSAGARLRGLIRLPNGLSRLLAPALDWPNHLLAYLLLPFLYSFIFGSTNQNTNELIKGWNIIDLNQKIPAVDEHGRSCAVD